MGAPMYDRYTLTTSGRRIELAIGDEKVALRPDEARELACELRESAATAEASPKQGEKGIHIWP